MRYKLLFPLLIVLALPAQAIGQSTHGGSDDCSPTTLTEYGHDDIEETISVKAAKLLMNDPVASLSMTDEPMENALADASRFLDLEIKQLRKEIEPLGLTLTVVSREQEEGLRAITISYTKKNSWWFDSKLTCWYHHYFDTPEFTGDCDKIGNLHPEAKVQVRARASASDKAEVLICGDQ